jgi:16S rRNA (adenine1518-N6/adenine1519-N6)-dimethyltransferase
VQADALRLLASREADWREWKLVANLPYSAASPMLVTLAQAERPPERLVATLQLEVVRRLLAEPGSKDYGILTLLIQLRFEPAGWFKVPRDCFHPVPDVDSGCIRLRRRAAAPLTPAGQRVFNRVVKRAFSERRKKAIKLLKFDWPAATLEEAWRHLGLPELARAEDVSREQFIELAHRLAPSMIAEATP